MRSYETARKSFGFMELFAKALVVVGISVGILATIPALLSLEHGGTIALLGALPGVALAAIGFFAQAYVQTSRATVDSAEYAQLALGVAREQLQISKQMFRLAQGLEPVETYTTEPANAKDLTDVKIDTDEPKTTPAEHVFPYRKTRIEERAGAFQIDGKSYPTLEDAKLAVDSALDQVALAKT